MKTRMTLTVRHQTFLLLSGCGILLLSACSDATSETSARADSEAYQDAHTESVLDTTDVQVRRPPVVAPRDRVPFPVTEWHVLQASSPAAQALESALELGLFGLPENTVIDKNLADWSTRTPDDGGSLGNQGNEGLFAVAFLETEQATSLVLRADSVWRLWLNRAPQPGDPYHSGMHRIPFRTRPGTNVLVLRTINRGTQPQLEIEGTTDPLVLNTLDLTAPQFVQGDSSPQYLGIATLNTSDHVLTAIKANVLESEFLEATERSIPPIPQGAVTQVAFELRPKAPWPTGQLDVPVTLRVSSADMDRVIETTVMLGTLATGSNHVRTRLSTIDNSAQFMGVLPPSDFKEEQPYGLILSLHGAGVNAKNQSGSYAPKSWAYVIAPTNRRPFGFDWEAWGRIDAIEALNYAMESFDIDPSRVHLTGHSMGGHGSWQLGTLFPGRFGSVGPSAGWSSFYSYQGSARPSGTFARTQASSDTLNYINNLAQRAVYIIHGTADDNVPISEAYLMHDALTPVVSELYMHEEEGAGHWWDGDESSGTDCVDWPPLIDLMTSRLLNPYELEFSFKTPGTFVSDRHSYVTIRTCADPTQDCTLTSTTPEPGLVTLNTTNTHGLVIDGQALVTQGVETLIVDGVEHSVSEATLEIGPQTGKRRLQHGPFHEVLTRPFCFITPAEDPGHVWRRYAAWLISTWNIIGNGAACAISMDRLQPEHRETHNLVYLGIPSDQIQASKQFDISWDSESLELPAGSVTDGAMLMVFPEGERLGAIMTATTGSEYLLERIQLFTSRFVAPDFMAWDANGLVSAGFFDPNWRLPETR